MSGQVCSQIIFVWTGLAVVLVSCISPEAPATDSPVFEADQVITDTQLAQNTQLASEYLLRHLGPQGRFAYQRNAHPEAQIDSASYNVLRHMGAVYALGQWVDRQQDTQALAGMKRAANYLKTCCIRPFDPGEGGEPAYGLWSLQQITDESRDPRLKLGGTALGLIGLLAIETHSPGFTGRDTLRLLAEGILRMQRADGSFHAIYDGEEQAYSRFLSFFYPGEAMLALVDMYRYEPNERWLAGVRRGLRYLATSRSDIPTEQLAPDHWMLLALSALLTHVPGQPLGADTELILAHAERTVRRMLGDQVDEAPEALYFGSFREGGSVTTVATYLEGILAIMPFLEERAPDLSAGIRLAWGRALSYAQEALITEGPLRGGVTTLPRPVYEANPELLPRASMVQIDQVQHLLSAWLWSLERWDSLTEATAR